MKNVSNSSLTEKIEHSVVIDLLQIGVYAYLAFALYQNLGYSKEGIFSVSLEPTILGFQLAAVLIVINLLELIHDKVRGGGGNDILH